MTSNPTASITLVVTAAVLALGVTIKVANSVGATGPSFLSLNPDGTEPPRAAPLVVAQFNPCPGGKCRT
jgi:hypothetical protein